VLSLSLLSGDNVTEKFDWTFRLYDLKRDGVISRDELFDVVTSVYDLLGDVAEPQILPDTIQQHVDAVFQVQLNLSRSVQQERHAPSKAHPFPPVYLPLSPVHCCEAAFLNPAIGDLERGGIYRFKSSKLRKSRGEVRVRGEVPLGVWGQSSFVVRTLYPSIS